MNKIQVLQMRDGYELLYINDLFIDSGKPLNGDSYRIMYFVNLGKKYNVFPKDMMFYDSLSKDDIFKDRFSEYNAKDLVRRF